MDRKLKVMHLIWSMGAGGAQQVVLNYLQDFKDDPDIELGVYVFTGGTDSKYDQTIEKQGLNAQYLNYPKTKIQIPYVKRVFQLPVSRKAWQKAIHEFDPDIVHVHIANLLDAVLPAIVSEGVPLCFVTLHSDPRRSKGRELKVIQKAFQDGSVLPVCITEEQSKIAETHYGAKDHEIIRNGMDIGAIRKQIIPKSQARKWFEMPVDAFVVLAVGRLNPIKNYSLLVEVFAQIQKKRPNALLIFAGDGKEKRNFSSK